MSEEDSLILLSSVITSSLIYMVDIFYNIFADFIWNYVVNYGELICQYYCRFCFSKLFMYSVSYYADWNFSVKIQTFMHFFLAS